MRVRASVRVCACVYAPACAHGRARVYVCTRVCTHACMRLRACARARVCVSACTRAKCRRAEAELAAGESGRVRARAVLRSQGIHSAHLAAIHPERPLRGRFVHGGRLSEARCASPAVTAASPPRHRRVTVALRSDLGRRVCVCGCPAELVCGVRVAQLGQPRSGGRTSPDGPNGETASAATCNIYRAWHSTL